MTEAVLYHYWRSSSAYRVRIGLGLLGMDWRGVQVDLLAAEQRAEENLRRNPQGLVPTLEIDGVSLTQSLAILEYLDETRGAGWLPLDAAGKARVRAVAYAIAMEIQPLCNLATARYAVDNSGGGISMEGWSQKFIGQGFEAVERLLDHPATGPFCHGDAPGLADIVLVPQVYNARRWEVDLSAYPRLADITGRLEALPAFTAAHPDRFKP